MSHAHVTSGNNLPTLPVEYSVDRTKSRETSYIIDSLEFTPKKITGFHSPPKGEGQT
jgi:hypothetical protein